jgi:hypothetical protein
VNIRLRRSKKDVPSPFDAAIAAAFGLDPPTKEDYTTRKAGEPDTFTITEGPPHKVIDVTDEAKITEKKELEKKDEEIL